ncbi:MAG TPA: glycosyltransferase family 2 protein [Rhizomicrobium sp.]
MAGPGGAIVARLSCYLLTHNSAKRLEEVLASLSGVADEIVVVDSGSSDRTLEIAAAFDARILERPMDSFSAQRAFAVSNCQHAWVLSVDSDEVLSTELAARIMALKEANFEHPSKPDAYAIKRRWFIMGREVHCFYPSHCPDFPIRLFLKEKALYSTDRKVHENMHGFSKAVRIDEPILHYSCDSIDAMYAKVNLYTSLAASDHRTRFGVPSLISIAIMPFAIAAKWYFLGRGWKDGYVGLIHARYVADSVYLKLAKARFAA